MPLDLVFTFEDGSTEQRWIAVDDWLRTVAVSRTYTYTFTKHPVHVAINPSNELFESNRLNNSSSWLPPMDVSLVPKYRGDVKPIDAYAIRSAPFIAAETYGWTLLGSYLDRSDHLALGLRVLAPSDGGKVRPGGVIQYHTPIDAFSPTASIDLAASSVGTYLYTGIRFNQVFGTPTGDWPHHTFMLAYDYSQPASDVFALNRIEFGYAFTAHGASRAFTLAADAETGFADPQTTYTKLSGVADLRQELGSDWSGFFRFFGGAAQPSSGTGMPLDAAYRLGSPGRLQSYIDDYTSNFGTDEANKSRNVAASGPLVRGYMLEGNPFGRIAASGQFELSNTSLFPIGFLKAIPFLGSLFRYTGLTLFSDAGFITDRILHNDLHGILRYDFGAGLRLQYLGRDFGLNLDRTEIQLDFPIYLSNVEQGPRYKFRQELFVRQNF